MTTTRRTTPVENPGIVAAPAPTTIITEPQRCEVRWESHSPGIQDPLRHICPKPHGHSDEHECSCGSKYSQVAG
jgi:hypothetical protein